MMSMRGFRGNLVREKGFQAPLENSNSLNLHYKRSLKITLQHDPFNLTSQ